MPMPVKMVPLTERELHILTKALRNVAPILDADKNGEDEHSKLYWKLISASSIFTMEREIDKWGSD